MYVSETSTGVARIYRMNWFERAFPIMFLAGSLVFLIGFWHGQITGERDPDLLELTIPIAFLLGGGLLAARGFMNFIALSGSAIELRTIFDRKVLPFDKIGGRRKYLVLGGEDSPSVWHLKVEPNDDRLPILDFEESYYKLDDAFRQWFNALPDLDALDKTRPKTSNFGLV